MRIFYVLYFMAFSFDCQSQADTSIYILNGATFGWKSPAEVRGLLNIAALYQPIGSYLTASSITGKMNYTDSAAMLLAYQTAINGKQASGNYASGVTNTGDNAANSTYASDYRAANFLAGTNYLAPNSNGSALTGLTKAQVGLSSVDNTTDANKPVSTATQTALNLKSAIYVGTDAGATDSYVITASPAPTSYTTGMVVIVKCNTINTGAASINVNSLGVKTIVKRVNTALANGDILALMFCTLVYDGTNFVLQNPIVN